MAYLTINNKFRPYSFKERLEPYTQYIEDYKNQEAALQELNEKASIWDKLLSEEDVKAGQLRDSYIEDLTLASEAIANEGLTAANRAKILEMKPRYSKDIVPIEQAFTRRRQLSEEQRQLRNKDNTVLFSNEANNFSINYLMENPEASYQSYSGALITNQVATAAANLAKDLRDDPRKWNRILEEQYYETIMRRGFSKEAVLEVMQESPEGSKILYNILNDAVNSSNVASWDNENAIKRAFDYGKQGLWNAIGETNFDTLNNKNYDFNLQNRGNETAESPFSFSGVENAFYRDSELEGIKDLAQEIYDNTDWEGGGGFKPVHETMRAQYEEDLKSEDPVKRQMALEALREVEKYNNTEGSENYNANMPVFPGGLGYTENDVNMALLLEELGYTKEEISKMDKSDKNKIVKSIVENPNDVIGRKVYGYQLDDASFKLLSDAWQNISDSPTLKKVESLRGGKYNYGKEKNIKDLYDKDINPVIYVDPEEGEFILNIKGDRYKIPKDLIGLSKYEGIQAFKPRVKNAKKLIAALQKKEDLTTKEVNAYQEAQRTISAYHKSLEDVVYSLGYTVKPINIAK